MPKVLIVDDNPVDRRLAGLCAQSEGFDFVFAENGVAALLAAEAERPDVVLTDLQMPEMDGLELVQEMKNRYPQVPVVLMTAHGSEEIAVTALKIGAASYVPKKNLKRDLAQTLRVMLDVVRSRRDQRQILQYLLQVESRFVVGYDPAAPAALVGHLQEGLRGMNLCSEAELLRVGTALAEALANAIEHGNLELDSALREAPNDAYVELYRRRTAQPPYCDRKVHVTARLTGDQALYVIRDEGPGFDPRTLPDPTDPANLMKTSGRGLLLIRTFMDDVGFNAAGNEITMLKRRQH